MQQEKAVINVHVSNGCTGFTIGGHIGQLVILTEGFTPVGCANPAGDV